MVIEWVVFEDTETVAVKTQGNRSALKGTRESGLIGKMKEFEEMELKRSDAACSESLAKIIPLARGT